MQPTTLIVAFAALAAVLGLVLLAGRVARVSGIGRIIPGKRLIHREALALDRTRRLHLVDCDGRPILLLTGGGADVVVGWLPPPDAAP